MDGVKPPSADTSGDHPGADARHRRPVWVKGFLIAGVVLAVIIVLALVTGGNHGPQRHQPDQGSGQSAGVVRG